MNNKKNILVIILSSLAVYANSLTNGFVWDDVFTVINNDFIKGSSLVSQIFVKPLFYFSNLDYLYYRPLQSLSYVADYSLWGVNAFGFHLSNVLLHIIASVLVYSFLNLLFSNQKLSFFSALLFALHPVNTSVVNYITSRADILFLIFTISSVMVFLKANNYRQYLLSVFFFVLALFSKETAVIFPVFLIFIKEVYSKLRNQSLDNNLNLPRRWYWSFLFISAAYLIFRVVFLGLKANFMLPAGSGFLLCVLTLCKIISSYLMIIIWPFNLHMLRVVDIIQLNFINIFIFLVAVILLVILLTIIYKRNKILFLASGLFLIWIIPVGALAFKNPEYYFQHKAIMEEHWLYLPSIGIFIFIYFIFEKAKKHLNRIAYSMLFLILFLFYGAITISENVFWKDNLSLFLHTSKYVKYSSTVYRNLGWIYLGKYDLPMAISMYSKALELKQDNRHKMVLFKDISYAYFLDNQIAPAEKACRSALNINDKYADAHAYLGSIYLRADPAVSLREWAIALDIDPFNAVAFNSLLELSRKDELIRIDLIKKYSKLLKATCCFERYKIYRSLGMIYFYNGIDSLAKDNFMKAIQINPYDVKVINAMAIYDAKSGNVESAIRLFKSALRINPFEKETYNNLAVLYNSLGNLKDEQRMLSQYNKVDIFK